MCMTMCQLTLPAGIDPGGCGQAVTENAKPMAEDLMHNQVKPAMVDAGATAEATSKVRKPV